MKLITIIVLYIIICYSMYIIKPEQLFNNDTVFNYTTFCILLSVVLGIMVN